MTILTDAKRDWIAFQESRGGFEVAPSAPTPERRSSSSSSRHRGSTSKPESPAKRPQGKSSKGDANWVPLVPPGKTPERPSNRQSKNSPLPSSPVPAALRRPSNTKLPTTPNQRETASLPSLPKPRAVADRSRTSSTQSSRSVTPKSERFKSVPKQRVSHGGERDILIDVKQHPNDRGRTRSASQPPAKSRGRSKSSRSKSRSRATVAPAAQANRPTAALTAQAKSAPPPGQTPPQIPGTHGRGRSSSRSRPPVTGAAGSRSNRRARSRSTSRTRVDCSPARSRAGSSVRSAPIASARPKTDRRRPPPSTSQSRRETKLSASSSSSIGPGVRAPPRRSSTTSGQIPGKLDSNIGRSIGFLRDKSDSAPLESTTKVDKGRKSGLMEKLFGDQVEKGVRAGLSGYPMRPRILLAATVYHNTATNLWITTINTNQRGVAKNPTLANKFLKAFSFSTENEARESAIANAPPKMVPFNQSPNCFLCNGAFALFRRASHCRNCGVCVCSNCSTTWPSKMIPETYNLKNEANVKICLSCHKLSGSFKRALLAGDYEEAVALYGTGNVNLRTPFPVSSKKDEVMHPIHCAVEGGNQHILRWLVDDHFCPVKRIRATSDKKGKRGGTAIPILTSKGRSVLSIAIDRLKVNIMRYLVVECGVSIYDTKDLQMSLRALEAALMSMPRTVDRRVRMETASPARFDEASFDDMSEPSSLDEDEPVYEEEPGVFENNSVRSKTSRSSSRGDSCIICFDRKIDCVATPCGHQVCCLECSTNLSACPVCNNRGSQFIKIFRP